MATGNLCAVDGCGKAAYVRGWCTTHYQRWQKHGDPLKGGWPRKRICEVSDCGRKVLARGLCGVHYRHAEFRPNCTVAGCEKKAVRTGLCTKHHKRMLRNGSVDVVQRVANGTYQRWLLDHVDHDGPDCLIWPFASYDRYGYGPSRRMCELAHGPAPTPDHEAAHSCGRGDQGCVHPKHLRWATHAENAVDMVDHGRSLRGRKNPSVKLTEEQVRAIRSVSGHRREFAERFGVDRRTIDDIRGRRSWKWLDDG